MTAANIDILRLKAKAKLRLKAMQEGAQTAKKDTPTGTADDPFTDVTQILGRRYPDNPEASRLFNNPEAQAETVAQGQRAAVQELPAWERFAGGAGRFAYGFNPTRHAQGERAAFDQATAGDMVTTAGRLTPEIIAATAGGAALSSLTRAAEIAHPVYRAMAEGLAYGAPSTALHQAESLADNRKFHPIYGLAEMGASAAIPGAGAAAGQFLKAKAPEILRSAVKPILAQMDTPNPPNFEAALERGLVPYFGGVEGASKRAGQAVDEIRTARDAAAAAASAGTRKYPFTGGPLAEARAELQAIASDPRRKMLSKDEAEAFETLDFWADEFAKRPTAKGGWSSVEDAIGLREKIDKSVNWRKQNQKLTPGFEAASKLLRSKIETWMAKAHVAPEVRELTEELGGVLPVMQALQRRSLQEGNNYKLGLLDLGAMGVGGGVGGAAGGGSGAAVGTLAAMGALAGRRLVSTPGGAAMLYDIGSGKYLPPELAQLLMQTGRSTLSDELEAPQLPPHLRHLVEAQ